MPETGTTWNTSVMNAHRPARAGLLAGALLLAAATAPAALVAHWPLDADGRDTSGHEHHLTLQNGAVIRAGAGMVGGALGGEAPDGHLDGTNDRAVADGGGTGAAFYGIGGSGARTVTFWVRGRPYLGETDRFATLVSWGSGAGPNGGRYDTRLNDGAPAGRLRTEVNGGGINGGEPVVIDDLWHHVLIRLPEGATDLAAHAIFVDGRLISQVRQNNPVIDTQPNFPVVLGDSILSDEGTFFDRNFRGWMDDVAIYDDAFAGNESVTPAASAALLHGLGRLGAGGVEALPAAQALWVAGGSATLGGRTWHKLAGLPGTTGDFGGSLAAGDAFIVLDATGNGIALFDTPPLPPEFVGYEPPQVVAYVGRTVNLPAVFRGQPPAGFAIIPALPAGLTLHPATGLINGPPAAVAPPADYTVTARYTGRPDQTAALRLEVRPGLGDDFEGRSGGLDADPQWQTLARGNNDADFTFEPGGRPGQRVTIPPGPFTLAVAEGPAATAGQDWFASVEAFITQDSTWGGLALAVQDAFNLLAFQISDGTGGGGADRVRLARFVAGQPEAILSTPDAPLGFGRWYRLEARFTAAAARFDLAVRDAETGAVLWSGTATDTTFTGGRYGLTGEFGGPHRLDNFFVVAAPALTPYREVSARYAAGFPIPPNAPGVVNGPATGFAATPPLPAGLMLDLATGAITGAPEAVAPQTTHVITATLPGGGPGYTTLQLQVDLPGLTGYSETNVIARVGVPLAPLLPALFGGAPAGFAIAPTLPPGLALDPTTGILAGTPTTPAARADYLVTARYAGLPDSTFTLSLEVLPSRLEGYALPAPAYPVGRPVAPNAPVIAGVAPVSFVIAPALPAGLTLDPATGVLTGTPTAVAPAANYTVTATYPGGGTAATTLSLAVVTPQFAPTLQAYWPLTTDGRDYGPKGHHLTLQNGAANRPAPGAPGGGALGGEGPEGNLDGDDDRAVADGSDTGTPFLGIAGAGARTISVWMRALPFLGGLGNPYPTLVSWGGGANPNGARYDTRLLETAPAGRLRTEVNGGGINSPGPVLLDDAWHHALVLLPEGGTNLAQHLVFIDGRAVAYARQNNPAVDTVALYPVVLGDSILSDEGSFFDRNLRGWLSDVAIFADGDAGDAGVPPSVSAALLHGLGRLGGIGLDQLAAAQALWRQGGSATVAGRTWQKVGGLTGAAGDFGGSLAEGTAFIVLDEAGGGLALFGGGPVPAPRITAAGWVAGGFRIAWESVSGRRYRVEFTPALPGGWTVLAAGLTAAGAETGYTHTAPGNLAGYYQVVLE